MGSEQTPQGEFPGWRMLEDVGMGDGVPTDCERCGKLGTPRQQFTHIDVTNFSDSYRSQ